jgi:ubiquinone/menaquinone biosynthesis C-methylase UbiE
VKNSEFDKVATEYQEIHNKNLAIIGQDSEYFVKYKARIVAEFWRERGMPADGSMLDFGCGIGRTSAALREYVPALKYTGVDVSKDSVSVARARLADHGTFETFDGRKLPFENSRFDSAFAACVFHHIPPAERAAMTAEVFRVLKPGGYFFIFEHNPFNPATQYIVKTCEFDDDAILLTARETQGLLRGAGFTQIERNYIVFYPEFVRSRLPALEAKLGWLPVGAQYWVVGKKPA